MVLQDDWKIAVYGISASSSTRRSFTMSDSTIATRCCSQTMFAFQQHSKFGFSENTLRRDMYDAVECLEAPPVLKYI